MKKYCKIILDGILMLVVAIITSVIIGLLLQIDIIDCVKAMVSLYLLCVTIVVIICKLVKYIEY